MGKDIGRIYKHSQSQFSTLSIKAPVISYSDPQIFSAIKLATTSVPSITEKHQKKSVLCSQNTTHNDATITNNDDIQSCETQKRYFFNITTISTPNHHQQRIYSTSSSTLTSNTPKILPPVGK